VTRIDAERVVIWMHSEKDLRRGLAIWMHSDEDRL